MADKKLFSVSLYEKQKKLFRRLGRAVLSKAFANNLDKLALINKTDKGKHHWYTRQYKKHFHDLRKRRMNILEIGVGGYDDPKAGGNSLRMWKHYFSNSKIYSIDVHDKSLLQKKD